MPEVTEVITEIYSHLPLQRPSPDYSLVQVANYTEKKHKNILDMGCFTGHLGYTLKQQEPALDIVGVDLVQNMQFPSDYLATVKANLTDKGLFRDDEFDTVIASRLLHESDDQDVLIAHAFKWARKQVVFFCQYGGLSEVVDMFEREHTVGFFHHVVKHKLMLTNEAVEHNFGLRYQVSVGKGLILYVFDYGFTQEPDVNTFNWHADSPKLKPAELDRLIYPQNNSTFIHRAIAAQPVWR